MYLIHVLFALIFAVDMVTITIAMRAFVSG